MAQPAEARITLHVSASKMSNKSIAKRKSVEDVPASARDLRAYCHTPSDRSNVFSDSTMMIREYCHTPIQIKAKFIYNHLISSEINRASGYNSCNPALTASAAMPATWGKVMPTRIYNRGAVADPAAISSGCNVNRLGTQNDYPLDSAYTILIRLDLFAVLILINVAM